MEGGNREKEEARLDKGDDDGIEEERARHGGGLGIEGGIVGIGKEDGFNGEKKYVEWA